METTIRPDRTLGSLVKAYSDLMKWRIVLLLVFTTITAMVVAARGMPDLLSLIVTTIGGIFAAGGASALNQYLDRDMDFKMTRTSRRPIPSGRIEPIYALLFGLALIAWSVLILGLLVNWLTAVLALIGAIYYVVVYTMMLKRNTVVNIIIGGGAGAMPVLVGWAAVSGTVTFEAIILFAIVFFWTPPHSWALAILVNKDYAAAGVPMMPVAMGEERTRIQILMYSMQLTIVTLIPVIGLFQGGDMLGWFYIICAIILDGGIIYYSVRLIQEPSKPLARALYKYSSLYLLLLFLAMIVDRFLVQLF